MRNHLQRKAEILHSELGWFAYGLLQRVMDTEPDNETVKRLLLEAVADLRDLRKSYDPARPKLRRL